MSHLFQRPLCEMGRGYDYAYRAVLGEPSAEDGGGCDDRPHRVELYAAGADRTRVDAPWQAFAICPEHEAQLRRYDDRLRERRIEPRFRTRPTDPGPDARGR